ncbi:MAG: hypothetical protein ABI036_17760, partial [Fibrobacteria bacterium]
AFVSPVSLLFSAALLLTACGDDVQLERRTVTYPNGKSVREDWTFYRKPNGDSIAQGVHKKFFWSGSTSESVIWKEGKRDGSAQAWYENGLVKWQKSYDMGKRIKTWRLTYKDGQPWIIAAFKDDKLMDTVKVWDKDGTPEPKTAVFKDGTCVSGDCALLDAPVLPADTSAAAVTEKVEKTRDWEIVSEFLD